MKQEEKQILLNDLKYRLYTKTQCQCIWADGAKNGSSGVINELDTYILDELEMIGNPDCEYLFSDIKPFLRSMDSMTTDEVKELSVLLNYEFYVDDEGALVAEDDRHRINLDSMQIYIDWLIEHHFDFRGLIEMGLALEAPTGMYNF